MARAVGEPVVLQANGLEFSGVEAGPRSGELVLLLHGFPQHSYAWRHQIDALAGAGFHVLAPDQRGYMLSSKPDEVDAYAIPLLAQDALELARRCGGERFHVVGHDWGAALAWYLAQECPQRVRTAVAINGPHPGTVLRHSMRHPVQFMKGAYVGFFQLPLIPEATLQANGFRFLRQALRASSLEGTFTDRDLDIYQAGWESPGALTAMLNWYRALLRPGTRIDAKPIDVPFTVLWGDRDSALDKGLAEAGAAHCSDVRVHHFPDHTHWLPEEAPDAVNELVLQALGAG